MLVVQTSQLTKSFGTVKAVDHVSLAVREGEIYGFLGLNGAGKTTAIRLMLQMIKPDSGSCLLFGKEVNQASKIWNEVGYMVETPHAYPNLSVKENLEVLFKLRGLKDRSLIDETIDKLKLRQYADRKEKHLSLGNKQRLALAKALLHRPKLLILDEPINGLDPAGIVEIREFLKELSQVNRTTILLSSHILSEIALLASRIGIIHEGKLIKEINSLDLHNQIQKTLLIDTSNNKEALNFLQTHSYTFVENKNNFLATSEKEAIEHPEKIATLLVQYQLPPKMLHVEEENLEHYFLRIVNL